MFSGIWSYFSFQRRMLDVVLVGQGEDVAPVVELRPAGPAEDLMGRAGVDQLLLAGRPLHQRRQHAPTGPAG